MTGSAEIAGRIGSLLLAFPLAIAADLGCRFLWPEMAVLAFYCIFLGWVLPWVGSLIAGESHGENKMSFSEARRRTRFWPNDYEDSWSHWVKYILNLISSTLVGVAAAIIIAGASSMTVPSSRIYFFCAIVAVWLLGTIGMVVKDRRNSTSDAQVSREGR